MKSISTTLPAPGFEEVPEQQQGSLATEEVNNDRIIAGDVNLSDGINTETEIVSSATGDLVLDSVLDPPGDQSVGNTVAEEIDPVQQEQTEWTFALGSLPETVKGAMRKDETWNRTLDPRKLVKLMPIIEGMDITDSPEDRVLVRQLAEMTRATDDYGKLEENIAEDQELGLEVTSFLSVMAETGVPIRGLLELTRTEENVRKLMNLYEHNPGSLSDPNSSLGMIVRVAKLPLHGLATQEEDEKYYRNGQGHEPDVRDSVIATIIETAEYAGSGADYYDEQWGQLKEYVSKLEAKIPELQASGFPLEMIGKSLLTRFNPSERINIQDPEHESKIIDRCLRVGDGITELQAVDPVLAKEVVSGGDDLEKIIALGNDLEIIKRDEPEVHRLFNDIKQITAPVDGVEAINNCLIISRGIVNSPELYDLVKDEKIEVTSGGLIILPKNLRGIVNLGSLASHSGRTESFFQNCNAIYELLGDERIESKGLLHAADALDANQLVLFSEIMRSESVQEALNDPNLNKQLNEAIFSIYSSLDLGIVTKSLELVESTDIKSTFPLRSIIDVASQRWSYQKVDESVYQGLLFDSLTKASQHEDKDGNLYDSPELVGRAIAFVVNRAGNYDKPEAVAKEMLSWFESSGLPYAALPAVVGFAEEAEREGVAFEPMAVYKWIYEDPENIQRVSTESLHEYVQARLMGSTENNQDAESIIAEAEASAAERDESFRLLVNIKPSALAAAISESGGLQSIFDNVEMVDRGIDYKLRRSGVEIALGIRSLDSEAEHRVYGSCAYIDQGVPLGAQGYGEIVLVFDPSTEALAGTTFTPEDSFHGVNRLTIKDAKTVRHIKDTLGMGYSRTDEYVEAQIPGEVTIYDVQQIVVSSENAAKDLQDKLPPELAAKVVVR
jgi:hypothetical protein